MALYFLMLGLNPRLSLSLLPWSDFFLLLFFCYISSSIDPIRKHGRTRIRWAAPTRGQRRVRQGFCAYLFLLSAQTGEEREKKKACVWDSLLTIVLSLTISSFYYHIFFFRASWLVWARWAWREGINAAHPSITGRTHMENIWLINVIKKIKSLLNALDSIAMRAYKRKIKRMEKWNSSIMSDPEL